MLTPREFDQIKIAIFAMGQTKMNGRATYWMANMLQLFSSPIQKDILWLKHLIMEMH